MPFSLVSYARSLERTADDGRPPERVPWDLRQSIQRRVRVQPAAARILLATAAIIGRVAPRVLLLAVLEQPESEVLATLESVCQAGLLEEVGTDSYGFVHDVLHEVVESDLGLARRHLVHRQVAEALEKSPGPRVVEALAYHCWNAGMHERAAIYLEQAGIRAAARYAHGAAAAYYRDLVICLDGLVLQRRIRQPRTQRPLHAAGGDDA